MREITPDYLMSLVSAREAPCVSLYQPTHRHRPENQQDPIRFKNLLKELEASLAAAYPGREGDGLVERLRALSGDGDFWNHRTEGMAVLGSPGRFDVFDLQFPVDELVVVADSFHVKPLLRALQSADRFQVLGLTGSRVRLYEENRYALDPVALEEVPATITEALGGQVTEGHTTVTSFGTRQGGAPQEMHHGHGGRKDQVEIDLERFFRVVDRAVLEHHSRPAELPLLLVALPEHQATFREVSHNPFLMEERLEVDPDALSQDELRRRAWEATEARRRERIAKLVEDFKVARAHQLGSHDLEELGAAAAQGRIRVLLLEAERTIPGRLDLDTGRLKFDGRTHPEVDDVLDDLAEAVLRMDGEVVVVTADEMPSGTGAAAIYRF